MNRKLEWSDKFLILVIVATAVVTGVAYDSLASQLPVHWGVTGEVNRVADRWFIWVTALLPVLILIAMVLAPKIDPRRESYERHAVAYRATRFAIVLLLVGVHWIILLSGLGYDLSVGPLTKAGVGLLFMVIGSVLGKVRPNYTFGIRLPWTLANDEVWRKTHRLGGPLFLMVGVAFLAMAPVAGLVSLFVPLGALLVVLLTTGIYAYRLHSRIAD